VPGLRRLRMERGFSQKQLADLIGITDPQLWRIEKGERTTLSTLGKLAAVLQVSSLEELLHAEEPNGCADQEQEGELVAT
jgi:transcriptional regulator with XRE-family HTH domain